MAIELTVSWNDLEDVYSINSTGQLIPFIIGAAVPVRIFYKYLWPNEAEERSRGGIEIDSPLSIGFVGIGRGG